MRNALVQLADLFGEVHEHDVPVEEIVLHPDDFQAFAERHSKDLCLTGAPWVSGEVVAYLWGAAVRLDDRIGIARVSLSGELGGECWEHERPFYAV